MADNWASSALTLTNMGDWAKWTLTINAQDAINLNNAANLGVNYIVVRGALGGADLKGHAALIVNDVFAVESAATPGLGQFVASHFWVSNNRFKFFDLGFTRPEGIASLDYIGNPAGDAVGTTQVAPWFAGTNTVRLLWYGRDVTGGPQPFEVDFLGIQSSVSSPLMGSKIVNDWGNTGDDVFQSKPLPVPFVHDGYDAHVNPNPLGSLGSRPRTWILEPATASTGTAAPSTIEVVKFCPPVVGGPITATIRVTGGGSPLSGLVGAYNQLSVVAIVTALNAAGEATFPLFFANGLPAKLWFSGNDQWGPEVITVPAGTRICGGGWAVGHINMGSGSGATVIPPAGFVDNFANMPVGVPLSEGVQEDDWMPVFNGFGTITPGAGGILTLSPMASTSPPETHAALVVSVPTFGDIDVTMSMRTTAQLRTGSAPNAWEVGWALWNYTDGTHFYYFIPKPNGWELGKADPAYPGAQRFLATGSLTYAVGAWHTVRITQVGQTITAYANGTLLATFTDLERPYFSGSIGLYTEDATVDFASISA